MSTKKISELETTSAVSTSDLMETAIPSGSSYASKKMSIAQLATYLENSVVHSALDTQNKTIIDAINELKSICDSLSASHFIMANQLPTSDINMNAIYLIPKQSTGVNDVYEEYICLDDTTTPATWEKIGETQIDLSNYISFDDADIATTSKNGSMSKADRSKMNGIESGAQKNVQSDWNASSGDALILNKPTIPTVNNNTISITQNGTAVDSFTLNQNSNKTIEVNDEKVKQTEMTDDKIVKSLAIASDNTTTADTDGVEKCNGLAMRINKNPHSGAVNSAELYIGNNIAVGSADNYVGVIRMFGTDEYFTTIHAGNSTDNREIVFPDADGTLALQEQNSLLGAKNLLPYPYEDTTKSVGTLNFTDNGDGTITINGTANSNARFYIDETISNPINYPLKGGLIYKFSRGYTTQTDAYIFIRCYYTANLSNNESVLVELKNEDKNIDLTNYPTIYGIRIGIVVANGTVVNNITFKPMIRLASITDETWEPFAKTNYWLTKDQYTQEQNNILGAKNLITFPYYHGFSRTTNNVVFTVDNDGIITVGGTQASGNASFYLMYNVKLPNGTYTLSDGGVGTTDTYLSCVYYTTPSASAQYYDVANNGSVTFTVNNWDRAIIRIWSRNGKTADNLVFKPMLRLSTIADSTFEPYAETNRQLTVTKLDISEIASVENSNTASQAYAVGDYMIWRGGFYRVVSAISSGGVITLNTNVTKTTLGAELKRALT